MRLLETQVCVPGSRLSDIKENENALLAPRAYIAFVCLLLFVVAIAAMLFPLCDIFSIVGTCASRVEHLRPVRGQHASYGPRAMCERTERACGRGREAEQSTHYQRLVAMLIQSNQSTVHMRLLCLWGHQRADIRARVPRTASRALPLDANDR